jgi:hypothetical protein
LREKTKQKKPKTKQQNKTKQNKKIPLPPQQSILLHTHEQTRKTTQLLPEFLHTFRNCSLNDHRPYYLPKNKSKTKKPPKTKQKKKKTPPSS